MKSTCFKILTIIASLLFAAAWILGLSAASNMIVVHTGFLLSFALFVFIALKRVCTVDRSCQENSRRAHLLEQIVEKNSLVVLAQDPNDDFRCTLCNKQAESFYLLPREKIIGSTDLECGVAAADAAKMRLSNEDVMRSGQTLIIERVAVAIGGRGMVLRIVKTPLYNSDGSQQSLLLTIEDVTAVARTQQQLLEFEAAIKHSEDLIIILKPEGTHGSVVTFVNEAFTRMFGYSPEEVIGKSPKMFHSKNVVQNIDPITLAIARNGRFHGELLSCRKDKTDFWQSVRVFAVLDTEGQVKNYVVVGRDITEEKKRAEEVQRAQEIHMRQEEILYEKERAEEANQAKSEFLASMSHELRTPLNSIIGMSKLMLETNLDKEQMDNAIVISQSATHLLEIVNDILDLSKIEAHEVCLENIGFDFIEVLNSVVSTLTPLATNKKLRIERDYLSEKFPYVLGDPTRVARIFTNLIGNAIKYTDVGGVRLSLLFDRDGDSNVRVTCKIIDSGIGIPDDKLDAVFEKFVQADTSTTRRYGGTGLGLAITKQLVELMGGTIGVVSRVGRGSTFWFTIPFAITDSVDAKLYDKKTRSASGSIPLAQARILIAEDHPMNQILMSKMMKKMGIQNFKIVSTGKLVLDVYKTEKWDVIIMDVHMPEMNGFEATTAIRVLEHMGKQRTPIIALTADAMTGDREKCLRYDMDDYISKPVSYADIKEVLSQWIDVDSIREPPNQDSAQGVALAREEETLETLLAPKPVDLAHLYSFTGGSKEAERELIHVFVEQSDLNIVSMMEHSGDGPDAAWVDAAHMLKGSAAAIGAVHLAELCYTGQKQADALGLERRALLEEVRTEYEIVKDFLRKMGDLD